MSLGPTRKICPKCGVGQAAGKFQLYKGSPMGWCRECRTQKERERRLSAGIVPKKFTEIVGDKKSCAACLQFRSLSEFSPAARGLGGKSAYCKSCFTDRYRVPPEAARAATIRYRTTHSERWRGMHRVHQAVRRSGIRVADDGSVTDGFIKSLYGTELCYICSNPTERKDRTADHVIPLSKGGPHSAANLKMACRGCNSRKGNRT